MTPLPANTRAIFFKRRTYTSSATPYAGDSLLSQNGEPRSITITFRNSPSRGESQPDTIPPSSEAPADDVSPSDLSIDSFILVDINDPANPIDLVALTEGRIYTWDEFGGKKLSVRVSTSAAVKSVLLTATDKRSPNFDTSAPFVVYGDNAQTGVYRDNLMQQRNYTLTATPYGGDDLNSLSGASRSISFRFQRLPAD